MASSCSEASAKADAADLLEWEMSAGRVCSLVAAIALVCGLMSLFG
jgi:hypothetical protein